LAFFLEKRKKPKIPNQKFGIFGKQPCQYQQDHLVIKSGESNYRSAQAQLFFIKKWKFNAHARH